MDIAATVTKSFEQHVWDTFSDKVFGNWVTRKSTCYDSNFPFKSGVF